MGRPFSFHPTTDCRRWRAIVKSGQVLVPASGVKPSATSSWRSRLRLRQYVAISLREMARQRFWPPPPPPPRFGGGGPRQATRVRHTRRGKIRRRISMTSILHSSSPPIRDHASGVTWPRWQGLQAGLFSPLLVCWIIAPRARTAGKGRSPGASRPPVASSSRSVFRRAWAPRMRVSLP
jgi:hypothetical protein